LKAVDIVNDGLYGIDSSLSFGTTYPKYIGMIDAGR